MSYCMFLALLGHSKWVVSDGVGLVHGLGLHRKRQGATPVFRINNWLQIPQGICLVRDLQVPVKRPTFNDIV